MELVANVASTGTIPYHPDTSLPEHLPLLSFHNKVMGQQDLDNGRDKCGTAKGPEAPGLAQASVLGGVPAAEQGTSCSSPTQSLRGRESAGPSKCCLQQPALARPQTPAGLSDSRLKEHTGPMSCVHS